MKNLKTITKEIVKRLSVRKNSYTYEHPASPLGMPVIHHICKGQSFWFEVISKDAELSDTKKNKRVELEEAGAEVYSVESFKQAKEILCRKQ